MKRRSIGVLLVAVACACALFGCAAKTRNLGAAKSGAIDITPQIEAIDRSLGEVPEPPADHEDP